MPQVPNYGDLARQQQQYNDDATRRTTWAQRPDQSSPMGSNVWNQDASGRWINTSTLTPGAQGLFDQTMQGQTGLAGTIGQGVDYGALPAMPGSGFGADQSVIDAWTALNEPGLQRSESAARARAAAMGLTMGSNAWSDQERSLGNVRTDASNKAILEGTREYGNVFGRGLQARQQAQSEADRKYAGAIAGSGALTSARDSLNPNKWYSDVAPAAAYIPQTVYGAAQDQFNSEMMNRNADIAERQGTINAGVNLGGQLAGQIPWGQVANAAWNWGSDYFGGGSDWDWTGSAEYF